MKAKIIDGKKIAGEIKEELRKDMESMKQRGIAPGLAVVKVGSDPASAIYVRNKKKAAEELGIYSEIFEMLEDTKEKEILALIDRLNKDKKIHGILIQLPLPKHINEEKVILTIDPRKDVDCFHFQNVGELSAGHGKLLPCTPAGVIEMLKREGIEISGRECVVVGRSNIVGKPLAMMLTQEHGTVTVAHSKTKNLKEVCRRADILISAVGKPKFITSDMVKSGAVVVDVGINRDENGKLVGDVDYPGVCDIASCITPVPGGVGPMTIVMLMKNTIQAAKQLGKL